MTDPLVISIDAMGGDHGPVVVVPGVALALKSFAGRDVRFLLHGDQARIAASLAKLPAVAAACEIRPADRVIAMDEKPAQAMRRGKGSSMWNAVESVKAGEAGACISAGNTGALMAISRLLLRMSGELDRPALVANWPTARGFTAVLDVGANVQCDAQRLVDFAVMGAAFHQAMNRSGRPTVGLMNVGSEDEKGHEEVREAHRMLRETKLDLVYHGFVEGDDIAKGTVDVVVTDGFTGNVALKTAEGLAQFFTAELRKTFKSSPLATLGAMIASGALRALFRRFDPSGINAAPFLGLNGIVVKTHGGADARGIDTAIRLAAKLADGDFAGEIDRSLKQLISSSEGSAGETGERSQA